MLNRRWNVTKINKVSQEAVKKITPQKKKKAFDSCWGRRRQKCKTNKPFQSDQIRRRRRWKPHKICINAHKHTRVWDSPRARVCVCAKFCGCFVCENFTFSGSPQSKRRRFAVTVIRLLKVNFDDADLDDGAPRRRGRLVFARLKGFVAWFREESFVSKGGLFEWPNFDILSLCDILWRWGGMDLY